jgi:20S proteasome alpha/beta subunit
MTAIVGILCKKGVVIGADSSTTFTAGQIRTIEQKTKKIQIVDNKYILAGTGSVGLGQRFFSELEKIYKRSDFSSAKPVELCRMLAKECVNNFASTAVSQGQYGALFAFPCHNAPHLCEFETNNLQPELKTDQIWYVSMGSGQLIADPFLGFIRKIFWHQGKPSLQEGILATVWAIQHAIDLNPGGINEPIDVAILEQFPDQKMAARFLSTDEIEENINNVKELEKHIGSFTTQSLGGTAPKVEPVQPIPKPD